MDAMFMKCANELCRTVREMNLSLNGTDAIEDNGYIPDIYNLIFDLVEIYLAPITGKERHSDGLNNLTTRLMYADKDELCVIMEEIETH